MPPQRPLAKRDVERLVGAVLGPEAHSSVESLQPKSRMSLRMSEGKPVMSEPVAAAAVSPTGKALIPAQAVPYVLAGSGVLAILGEELANPGPWSLSRILGFGVKVLGLLVLGATPGLRKT